LAACYLLEAKRGDGLPVDPVARFHLSNGAQIYDLHNQADLSVSGQKHSFGVMVNYLYEREKLVENHEKFVKDGQISVRKKIRDLTQKFSHRLTIDS